MNSALESLGSVDFDWVRSLDSIWSSSGAATGGPNEILVRRIAERFFAEAKLDSSQPRGGVLVGQPGVGKTHLVALLREEVWKGGGWFILLDVLGLTDFWRSAALSYLTSLLQEMPDGRRQYEAVLAGVARRFKVEQEVEAAFKTPNIQAKKIVDLLLKGLIRAYPQNALKHQDVFRALALLRSSDVDTMSLAHSWLQGYDADEQARATLGFLAPPPVAPVELIRGLSWIMSLAGPTLVAVDQIDGVVNPNSIDLQGNGDLGLTQGLGEVLAAGLLQLHDVRHRGKTIITCLFDSWTVLETRGLLPFRQRFDDPVAMEGMNQAAAVKALIVNRLKPAYDNAKFVPPFESWPFSDAAIAGAASVGMMPRTILMRCDAFRRACLENGKVDVCDSLIERPPALVHPLPPNTFDEEYGRHRKAANHDGLIAAGDDGEFGRLLREMFDLYARQVDPDEAVDVESKGDPAQRTPPLHGRLTFTYHDRNDRELHYCYRALEHNHAISFQARLRASLTASGISNRIPDRHLLIVRRGPIPSGPKTKQLYDGFAKAGGVLIVPSDDDLRAFLALREMREQALTSGRNEDFDAWLRSGKPLLKTAFFQKAGLSPPPRTPDPVSPGPVERSHPAAPPSPSKAPKEKTVKASAARQSPSALPTVQPDVLLPAARPEPSQSKPQPQSDIAPSTSSRSEVDAIPVGRRMAVGEEQVTLATKLLPRHTAIIAGSGSGKTVLLRRIVEEAALAGIPAIVIDPNNDLSRLGDAWPERPSAFTSDDDAKVRRYRDAVEVVVWTPGVHAGNPLFLPVMPDFAGLGDDKDDRQQAVEMASETLAPLAGAKSALQRGVLVEALRYFAGNGGGDLARFTALLSELPEGLSPIGNAEKLAAGMADQLHAAVATNPLLKADGPLLDPNLLFFGSDPARTRLSVINLSGLATDAAREDFVNRLQMSLFAWIKKNPSRTGLLYVIDEAQNFLPSQKPALSLNSGVKLVAQARKYGLGMIVATQVPRGIHNQVVSNCTTQFFGKQNAPATIGAAQEIIAASGGRADDIGKLKAGEFYFATEGSGRPAKLRTPICLSYHPQNPPTPEEVIARARLSIPSN
jgi:DNA helicase HerA-like ATPase